MSSFRIYLFQRFDVSHNARDVDAISSQKAQELICYLLIFRHRAHHRELLASKLWENGNLASAKKNLRQVLWHLNGALTEVMDRQGKDVISVDREWIQVNTDAGLWLDIAEFEQAYQRVKGKRGRELSAEQADRLASTIQLYRGDLLEGWYQTWCIYERERLHDIYLAMLDKLLGYAEANQQYDAGIHYGSLALRSDPARERTHRRLMRLHYLAGHRSAALQQFRQCANALRDELGVDPGESTLRLYDALREDRLQFATPSHGESCIDTLLTHDDILGQLDLLQSTIASLQAQVNRLQEMYRSQFDQS